MERARATDLSSAPDGGYYAALDALRGLAALGVALYHFNLVVPLSPYLAGGYLYVDFFFVLSGFVISAAYADRLGQGFSNIRFVILRIGRVYPLHLAVLALEVLREALQVALHARGLVNHTGFLAPRTPEDILPVAMLLQVFQAQTPQGWSVQSWSISAELIAYTIFGFSWFVTRRLAALLLALLAAVAFWGLHAGLSGYWAVVNPDLLRGLAGFGLGCTVWCIWSRGLRDRLRRMCRPVATMLEVLLCCIAIGLPIVQQADPNFLLVDFAFALAVLVFAAERGWVSAQLRRDWFVWLGTVSFSLYMVHSLVIASTFTLATNLLDVTTVSAGGFDTIANPSVLFVTGFCALNFLLFGIASQIAWRVVEMPARGWARTQAGKFGSSGPESRAPTF